jgi:hypothetical protein
MRNLSEPSPLTEQRLALCAVLEGHHAENPAFGKGRIGPVLDLDCTK